VVSPYAGPNPERDREVSEPAISPLFPQFVSWLGGMTQDEAGLTIAFVLVA
jgi:hypothetical protein